MQEAVSRGRHSRPGTKFDDSSLILKHCQIAWNSTVEIDLAVILKAVVQVWHWQEVCCCQVGSHCQASFRCWLSDDFFLLLLRDHGCLKDSKYLREAKSSTSQSVSKPEAPYSQLTSARRLCSANLVLSHLPWSQLLCCKLENQQWSWAFIPRVPSLTLPKGWAKVLKA